MNAERQRKRQIKRTIFIFNLSDSQVLFSWNAGREMLPCPRRCVGNASPSKSIDNDIRALLRETIHDRDSARGGGGKEQEE